jgi:hypothetical protein
MPQTNRNKQMISSYLATFMLHQKWRGIDGFLMFMQYAAKLYGYGVKRLNKLHQHQRSTQKIINFLFGLFDYVTNEI